jgi:hypothetical protein
MYWMHLARDSIHWWAYVGKRLEEHYILEYNTV